LEKSTDFSLTPALSQRERESKSLNLMALPLTPFVKGRNRRKIV
jgi:hypothetical protein